MSVVLHLRTHPSTLKIQSDQTLRQTPSKTPFLPTHSPIPKTPLVTKMDHWLEDDFEESPLDLSILSGTRPQYLLIDSVSPQMELTVLPMPAPLGQFPSRPLTHLPVKSRSSAARSDSKSLCAAIHYILCLLFRGLPKTLLLSIPPSTCHLPVLIRQPLLFIPSH